MTERAEEIRKLRLHQRARIAALSRARSADDPELLDAKRELATLKIEAAILQFRSDPANPPIEGTFADRLTTIIMETNRG